MVVVGERVGGWRHAEPLRQPGQARRRVRCQILVTDRSHGLRIARLPAGHQLTRAADVGRDVGEVAGEIQAAVVE